MYRNNYSPSLSQLILATLASGRNTYKFKSLLFKGKIEKYKKKNIGVELARLHKRGYIKNSDTGWSITNKGNLHTKQVRLMSYLPSPFKENIPSTTILSFDIPEKNRKVRNWLRNQIKIFGYKILQQSLWVGPGPLPQNFLKRLEDLNIRKNVKTFKIKV